MELNKLFEPYKEYLLREGKSKVTIYLYLKFFESFTSKYERYNQASINNYLNNKTKLNSPNKAFLSSFKRFLVTNYNELGLSPQDIIDIKEVDIPKVRAREKVRVINPLTPSQVKLLSDHIKDPKFNLMLKLTYMLGLRMGELLKLRFNSFYWDEWLLNDKKTGKVKLLGKGNKEGLGYLRPELMDSIYNYCIDKAIIGQEYLFLNNKKPKINSAMRLWEYELLRAGLESGITIKDSEGKPIKDTIVHPHKLRHSYATRLFNEGADIKDVQELLRHSSITSTQRYVHVSEERLRDKIANTNFF